LAFEELEEDTERVNDDITGRDEATLERDKKTERMRTGYGAVVENAW